ncbi:MAG TPA: hypothetical protein VKA15_26355 [Isosphaeraceae bacterium]|nr:hypothetical protein [Isosphaeraceae bacterium]
MATTTDRRRFFNVALQGAVGAGAMLSLEENILQAALQEPAHKPEQAGHTDPAEPLPCGKLGKLTISRLIMGGNLIGGYAHSRDLLYVSRLLRAYNTDSKIFETLALAERCGVTMIQLNPGCFDLVERYRKERGGTIQVMVCVDADPTDPSKVRDQVQELAGRGAQALYTHGERTDRCVMNGNIDAVGRVVELIKAAGVPAGIGSHSLETPITSQRYKLNPDFYVKTLHPDSYWSATPPEDREEWCWYKGSSQDHDRYHDNIFCLDPRKTVDFMQTVDKPWFAFKVMAAGALSPQIGFNFAYQNGADFIIAGMFDFQVNDDVAIARKSLRRAQNRTRPWRA